MFTTATTITLAASLVFNNSVAPITLEGISTVPITISGNNLAGA